MPELPEVETIKLQMQKELLGKTIQEIVVKKVRMWEGNKKQVEGQKIKNINRMGKMIIWKSGNNTSVVFHMRMSGQLVINGEEGKYSHVIIKFTDNTKLVFNDMRQFGRVTILSQTSSLKINKKQLHERLGPDPLGKEFTISYFTNLLAKSKKPIKILLLEQEKIAGIGNIYANEALFCAGINPSKTGLELVKKFPEKVGKLSSCIKKVLQEAIKYGGTSGNDEQYVNLYGEKGKMQNHVKV